MKINELLIKEAYDAYRFLIDYTNFDESNPGCGVTCDKMSKPLIGSIASTGFMLSGLVIGCVNKWDKYDLNLERAKIVLRTFAYKVPHFLGFFVHYLNLEDGKRYRKCEYSTIDTVLFINGMLTVDSYFDDEEIHSLTKLIYERIDWLSFTFMYEGKLTFHMAYNDITGGDYLKPDGQGFIYQWNMTAEQLSMYILASGSDKITKDQACSLYNSFDRPVVSYANHQFVASPLGSLFVYLFSHAWVDFKDITDINHFNWWNNSKEAIIANNLFCTNNQYKYRSFQHSWGISACDGPQGYRDYGAYPFFLNDHIKELSNDETARTDGTIANYAYLASLPFIPVLVEATYEIALKRSDLFGPYGIYDSFNDDVTPAWVSKDYYGIDKGITLLMIDNNYHKTTWKYYMSHKIIKAGLSKLEFTKNGRAYQKEISKKLHVN